MKLKFLLRGFDKAYTYSYSRKNPLIVMTNETHFSKNVVLFSASRIGSKTTGSYKRGWRDYKLKNLCGNL